MECLLAHWGIYADGESVCGTVAARVVDGYRGRVNPLCTKLNLFSHKKMFVGATGFSAGGGSAFG
ncbi:MAG: hypothetical protein KF749_10880 [Bacteroidetes bacterium]|nr:hypothetical protein [Bacteroidota bacterium]MCW5895650.1 hypothetical protein [Bacteroidota bacterium]